MIVVTNNLKRLCIIDQLELCILTYIYIVFHPFQIISRFDFFWCINFAIHLDT